VGIIDVDPAYHESYVYGNVFYNTDSQGLNMFTYDSGGIQGQPRNGTLYFYNNTVVNVADQATRYYTDLFALPSQAEVAQWGVQDVLDCRNNVLVAAPVTSGATGTQVLVLPYGSTNFAGTITGTNTLIYGDKEGHNNPGFVSLTATNFQLLSSARAIDAAGPQADAVLATGYTPTSVYVDPTNSALRQVNGLRLDLGAFEGTSTNVSGPLCTLTVSNGFGGGGFPAGAVVPVAAYAAPAGEAFAGWTNFGVSNGGYPGATLVMPGSNVLVTATYTNLPVPTNYVLTVVNGTGAGTYLPGTVVTITADTAPAGQTFASWSGYAVEQQCGDDDVDDADGTGDGAGGLCGGVHVQPDGDQRVGRGQLCAGDGGDGDGDGERGADGGFVHGLDGLWRGECLSDEYDADDAGHGCDAGGELSLDE